MCIVKIEVKENLREAFESTQEGQVYGWNYAEKDAPEGVKTTTDNEPVVKDISIDFSV